MKIKRNQFLCGAVIFILLVANFLNFKQNLVYKNIIGDFTTRTILHANDEVQRTIVYLEGDNLKEEDIKEHLNRILDFGIYNESFSLDLPGLLRNYYDSRKICNDKTYRGNVIERLRRIGELISYILKNSDKNKEKHYTYKYRIFFGDEYNSVIYYDYLRNNKDDLNNMIKNIKES